MQISNSYGFKISTIIPVYNQEKYIEKDMYEKNKINLCSE